MEKKYCYIFWDSDKVPEDDRKVYLQCEECFKKSKKGFSWPYNLLKGGRTINCNICKNIIYQEQNAEDQITD